MRAPSLIDVVSSQLRELIALGEGDEELLKVEPLFVYG